MPDAQWKMENQTYQYRTAVKRFLTLPYLTPTMVGRLVHVVVVVVVDAVAVSRAVASAAVLAAIQSDGVSQWQERCVVVAGGAVWCRRSRPQRAVARDEEEVRVNTGSLEREPRSEGVAATRRVRAVVRADGAPRGASFGQMTAVAAGDGGGAAHSAGAIPSG